MTTREFVPNGAPCWIDLASDDPDRTASFYTALLGWEADAPNPEFGGYFMFTREGVPIAGGSRAMAPGQGTDHWSVYLAVEDAAKTLEVAADRGAQVVVPAMPVGEMGTMAMLVAPDGSAVGIWQPGLHKGILVTGEHGAPGWFELHSGAYDRALDFYGTTFGWATTVMSDTPEFRYTTVGDAERPVAGVVADPPPARGWYTYFWVDDTDAVAAQAARLGGTVVDEPVDTPYGRLAGITDPLGVPFGLMAANEMMPARTAGSAP